MTASELATDEWVPPDARAVAEALSGAGAPYWICAGLGLDLFVGSETRAHHDSDVAILRRDQSAFRTHLRDWDLRIAIGWQNGRRIVTEWVHGQQVPSSEGPIWCRPDSSVPWMFELLLNESEDDSWCFKRNRAIRLPLEKIGGVRDGLPFLNPELILLHKATSANYDSGDDRDFQVILPLLDSGQREWLSSAIARSHPTHPWIEQLEG